MAGQARLSRRRLLAGLGVAAVGFSLSACGNADERRLNLYNWQDYIGETTLEDFRARTGVRVVQSFFATNDELFAKLKAGNPG